MSELLAGLLAEAFKEQKSPNPSILPEAMVARLKDEEAFNKRSCPFLPGDLVTGRLGTIQKNSAVGIPALVLEVLHYPQYAFTGEAGTVAFGMRYDMRILRYAPEHDSIFPLWVDSANHEPYQG